MELLALLITIAVVFVAIHHVDGYYRRRQYRFFLPLNSEEPALNEWIRMPFDSDQLERLRPLVEQVGIVRELKPESAERDESFQVFVIDSRGAMHDVWAAPTVLEARSAARELARGLEAELLDELL